MSAALCQGRGLAEGVEWRADEHDFHLPELRTAAHRLAAASAAENVAEVLAAAKVCLLDAGRAYQQAQAERAAIADTAREMAAQRAAIAKAARDVGMQRTIVETATQELATMRAHVASEWAMLEEARARVAHPTRAARPRPKPKRPQAAISDIPGQNMRPDPAIAQDSAGLIKAMHQFRTWAGNPSYRDMAQRSGQRIGASTMWKALRAKDLPQRLAVIDAIIEGCGGSEEDRQRFATAWRRLTMSIADSQAIPSTPPRLHAVPAAGPAPSSASTGDALPETAAAET